MNSYELRQQARRERLERIAERLQAEGDTRYARARQMAAGIPFGQPILVGHHSEKRDRRYRARIDQNFSRGFEAMKEAQDARARAAAVGSGGVSSDDPDAVGKLREQLEKAERSQEKFKAVNAAIRKHKKAGPEAQVAALVALGLSDSTARKLLEPDFAGRIGVPSYQLTNLGANIRRIKARIEQLGKVAAAMSEPAHVHELAHYTVTENFEFNRVQLRFKAGKPPAAVREVLKRNGFRWAPSENAWQRMMSASVVFFATSLEGYIRREIEREMGGAP